MPAGPPPYSGSAIAGFVCSIIGCLGITAIAGFILGIMGILSTKAAVSLLFFFPYVAIRLVIKKRAQ